ncbi:MAG: hypothetical protein ACLP07_10305 [Terracidiphilus sp.]
MPISYALLLCIPIGLLAYFEARWMLRFFLGRYEQKERKAAYCFAAFGALSVPLIYVSGIVGAAISGMFGTVVSGVLFGVVAMLLIGPLLWMLMERKWRSFGRHH